MPTQEDRGTAPCAPYLRVQLSLWPGIGRFPRQMVGAKRTGQSGGGWTGSEAYLRLELEVRSDTGEPCPGRWDSVA